MSLGTVAKCFRPLGLSYFPIAQIGKLLVVYFTQMKKISAIELVCFNAAAVMFLTGMERLVLTDDRG